MNTQVLTIEYKSEVQTLYCIWDIKTGNSSWQDMQKELIKYAEAVEKYKPLFILIDERKQLFVWVPEYQIWIDNNIAARLLEIKVQKIAFIKNEDFILQLSTEQIMDEPNAKQQKSKFFNSYKDAEQWFNA